MIEILQMDNTSLYTYYCSDEPERSLKAFNLGELFTKVLFLMEKRDQEGISCDPHITSTVSEVVKCLLLDCERARDDHLKTRAALIAANEQGDKAAARALSRVLNTQAKARDLFSAALCFVYRCYAEAKRQGLLQLVELEPYDVSYWHQWAPAWLKSSDTLRGAIAKARGCPCYKLVRQFTAQREYWFIYAKMATSELLTERDRLSYMEHFYDVHDVHMGMLYEAVKPTCWPPAYRHVELL